MKLNPKQEKYCRHRAAGDSYSKAYKAAGYSPQGQTKTATDNAYYMEHKSRAATDIAQRIEELRSRDAEKAVLNREDRLRLLSELAADEAVKPQDRIRACDQLARMQGDYNDRLQISAEAGVTMTYADRMQAIRQAMEEGAEGA